MRRLAAVVAVAALAVAACAGGGSGEEGGEDASDTSSGTAPYAIGKRTETFVDPTRAVDEGTYRAGSPQRRIPVTIWYPARGDAGEVVPDAEPAPGAPFPVVLWSHGTGGTGEILQTDQRRWVSDGYVLVMPTYPESSPVSCEEAMARAPLPADRTCGGQNFVYLGPDFLDFDDQPDDAAFVWREVQTLASDDTSWLHGVLDTDAFAVGGFSQGAVTAYTLGYSSAHRIEGVDTVIAGAGVPVMPGDELFTAPDQPPLLAFYGDADTTVPPTCTDNALDQVHAPWALLTVAGGSHLLSVGDLPVVFRDDFCDAPNGAAVCVATLAWLDEWLRDDDGAFEPAREAAADPDDLVSLTEGAGG